MSTLTITADKILVMTGLVQVSGKRQINFFGALPDSARFILDVEERQLLITRLEVGWYFIGPIESIQLRLGDQIVLDTRLPKGDFGGAFGRARLLDGSAVFLNHYLSRCGIGPWS